MVGVWVCGELERACRVCGAQGGGRPWCSGVGEQRWRVEDLVSYWLLGRCEVDGECERGAGGVHGVREIVRGVGVW